MEKELPREIKYSVIIPVFNEEDSVFPLFSSLKEVMDNLQEEYEIIFIDDASNDSTLYRLNELAKKYGLLRIIHFEVNKGQGNAIEEGFRNANGEIFITMDGDLQNDPLDIPRLISEVNRGFDLVCGYRGVRSDTVSKKINSKIGNFLQRKITHLKLHDISCTLRAYRKDIVVGITFKSKFDFSMLPYILSKREKVKITEVRILDNYRKFGKTKYKLINTIFGTLRDYIRLVFSAEDACGKENNAKPRKTATSL